MSNFPLTLSLVPRPTSPLRTITLPTASISPPLTIDERKKKLINKLLDLSIQIILKYKVKLNYKFKQENTISISVFIDMDMDIYISGLYSYDEGNNHLCATVA